MVLAFALLTIPFSVAAQGIDGSDAGAPTNVQAAPAPAVFEDEELLELLNTSIEVWSATKTARKLEEAPAIVTVINRPEINEWGYQSVGEILRHVLGFYVIDDHIIPNAAVRGVSAGLFGESSSIKVMLNGHSVAFRTTGGNWLGPELVPMSAIERIEVIRGPASALFGADAFLGVINIVTRTGADLGRGELRLSGGLVREKNGSFDSELALGGTVGQWDWMAAGRVFQEDRSGISLPARSPAPLIPFEHRGQTVTSGLSLGSKSAFASITRKLGANGDTSITLSPYFSMIDRGGEFASWAQLTHGLDRDGRSTGTEISLAQGSASLSIKSTLSSKLKLNFDSTFFTGGPTNRERIEVGSELYYVRRKFSFIGLDNTLEVNWAVLEPLTIVGGVSFGYDLETPQTQARILKGPVGDLAPGDELPTDQQSQKVALLNPGVYLQALWNPPITSLSFIGGVRYDFHNIYGSQLSGRLGAVWTPSPDLHLKLLYGSAFKAPSPFLLYATPLRSGDVIGNNDLSAQHVNTLEAELLYRLNKNLSLSTALAGSLLSNAADFTLVGLNKVARNVANIRTLSWESRLTFQKSEFHGYLQSELVFSTRETGDIGYQAELVGTQNGVYPGVMFHAGAAYKIPLLPLRAGLEGAYIGSRRASDTNILEAGRAYYLPSYFQLEGHISTVEWQVIKDRSTELKLTARNLLGATGPDPGFSGVDYPLAPRTLMLQLRQEL
jgi:outer membrane receptor for ferrienterochelin and colicins